MHGVRAMVMVKGMVYEYDKEVLLQPTIPDPLGLYVMAVDPAGLLNCWKAQECRGRGVGRNHQNYHVS
jgi:hypothetical protein